MTCAQVTEQLDKYVVGGLAAEVSAQITQHIETCERCSKALAQARSTADVLALVTETPQRPALRRRVMSAIQPAPQTSGRRAPPQALKLPQSLEPSPASFAVIFVLLMMSIAAVWGAQQMRDRLNEEQQTASLLQAQLDDRNALVALMADQAAAEYTVRGTNAAASASASFYANAQAQTGGLIVWNLPPSAPGTVYQVWLIDASGTYSSGGAFRVGRGGSASLLVRARLAMGSYRSLVVSMEPVRGNRQPSGPRVFTVSF